MTTAPRFIDVKKYENTTDTLPEQCGLSPVAHRFEAESLHAVNTALAAERPLLVRGEPGTGKSQLARAAAFVLKRAYTFRVLDAQTQVSDLFYSFDAVERLAQAQVAGAPVGEGRSVGDLLDELNFVRPGPLWWAFNAETAARQDERYRTRRGAPAAAELPREITGDDDMKRGFVALIDEIDKTDSSVPNGLLEALGQGTFPVPRGKVERPKDIPAPLIVITTNEERELPSAFLRRCVVLQIPVPKGREALRDYLIPRARAHFGEEIAEDLLIKTASMLHDDREAAQERSLPPPGQAEYLDLLRALTQLSSHDAQDDLLATLRRFTFRKHRELLETASKPR